MYTLNTHTMEMSAKMVVMSHLSDAQELIGFVCGSEASERINFAKYVILETKGNLNQDIDADAMYSKFSERMKRHQISPKFSDPTAE
jgi:hypothetical protein